MKYPEVEVAVAAYDVAPRTGAWIEIPTGGVAPEPSNASPPARGAWIEICSRLTWAYLGFSSLPARGAWIEIMMEGYSIYRMLSDRTKDLKAKAA